MYDQTMPVNPPHTPVSLFTQSPRFEARESAAGWEEQHPCGWLRHGFPAGRRQSPGDQLWVSGVAVATGCHDDFTFFRSLLWNTPLLTIMTHPSSCWPLQTQIILSQSTNISLNCQYHHDYLHNIFPQYVLLTTVERIFIFYSFALTGLSCGGLFTRRAVAQFLVCSSPTLIAND